MASREFPSSIFHPLLGNTNPIGGVAILRRGGIIFGRYWRRIYIQVACSQRPAGMR